MLNELALNPSQREALEEAAATYAAQLDDRAVAYLQARGLDEAAVVSARLGAVCDPLPGHEDFAGRISIPYVTPSGVVAIKYRDISGTSSVKYMQTTGQQPRIFNTTALFGAGDHIAICEGEFDALALTYLAGIPAVAIAGTAMWKPHYWRCFADFEHVYVCCDNDVKEPVLNSESGEMETPPNAGQKLAQKIIADIPRATNVKPPANVDVNEWLLAEGAEVVREAFGLAACF